jgi:tRNA(fMet)-specific endonuclease VapC
MLDTNICIHLIQLQPPEVMARFGKLMRGDVIISVVTLAELRHGVERNPELKVAADTALGHLLTLIPAIAFDTDAAVSYGILAAAIRDRRRDALDRLIAAQAISLGVTLVTNNESDFKDYSGLIVENRINRT